MTTKASESIFKAYLQEKQISQAATADELAPILRKFTQKFVGETVLKAFSVIRVVEIFLLNNRTIIELSFGMIRRTFADLGGGYRVTPSSICIILHIILSLVPQLVGVCLLLKYHIYWS